MKYCSKCGKELFDEAVVCPGCGCPVPGTPVQATQPAATQETEKNTMITVGMISAFLLPLLGVILGIVGMNKYQNPVLKQKSKSVLLLSLGMWIIYFFLILVMGQL